MDTRLRILPPFDSLILSLYEQRDLDIVFAPWIPLTSQKEIPVAPDWIITLVDPIPQVIQKYKEGIKDATSSKVPETSESGGVDLASDGSEC